MPPGPTEHRAMALAGACVVLGLAVLGYALLGLGGRAPSPTAAGTKPRAAVAAPRDGTAAALSRIAWRRLFDRNAAAHVPARWVAGFYPLYERAQRAFGVNWLLLASVHRQETAFSTAPSTYRGLNFARCCAGPMQFNVTNGPQTTWEQFRHAYRRAARPADYPNRTARHPSVYDDFDAVMAAGRLLQVSGATAALDASAWRAAYDYYGHDLTGVEYANQVVARAIEWSQKGFSINQPADAAMVAAVDAAWGVPVRDALTAEPRAATPKRAPRARAARR
jgi:hypothetical protein